MDHGNHNLPDRTGTHTPRGNDTERETRPPAPPTLPLIPFTRQEADQGFNNNDNITPDELREVFSNPAFRDFFVREYNSIPDEPRPTQDPEQSPTGTQTPPTRPATPTRPDNHDPRQLTTAPPPERHRPHILPRPNLCRQHSCSGHSTQNTGSDLNTSEEASTDDEFPCSQRLEQRNRDQPHQ